MLEFKHQFFSTAYPTHGLPLGPDGSPLPTDSSGRIATAATHEKEEEEEETARTLPTDATGRAIYPVVWADNGQPLPTDAEGRPIGIDGEPLPVDEWGRPLDVEHGRILPKNAAGAFVYTAPSYESSTTGVGRIVEVVGADEYAPTSAPPTTTAPAATTTTTTEETIEERYARR